MAIKRGGNLIDSPFDIAAADASINGSDQADTLYGTAGADTIHGFGGDDVLKGGGGADVLDGGAGFDTIFYGDSTTGVAVNLATGHGSGGTAEGDTYIGIDGVYGSSFNDTIIGNASDNILYGLDGNDILNGGLGADHLDGGNGNDILKGGGGADAFVGGAGIDTADYSQAGPAYALSGGVFVDLSTGIAKYGEAQGDTFSSIENLTGSAYDDYLGGTDGANALRGLDGNDQLYAQGGDDFLDGGNGNDQLYGGTGNDTMTGGAGDDTYVVDSAGDVVNEAAGQGFDVLMTSVNYALSATAEIEYLQATFFETSVAQDLTGNDFGQTIIGTQGSNVLQGLGGSDQLYGYDGFDRLFGGEGKDVLWGGNGPDDLIGGTGPDVFLYTSLLETGTAAGTFDVIHDFNPAEGDKIDVSQVDANPLLPGDQMWTFTGPTTFTAPGQIGSGTDGVDTFVFFNIDNDPSPEATIRILGVHNVDASWFVL